MLTITSKQSEAMTHLCTSISSTKETASLQAMTCREGGSTKLVQESPENQVVFMGLNRIQLGLVAWADTGMPG